MLAGWWLLAMTLAALAEKATGLAVGETMGAAVHAAPRLARDRDPSPTSYLVHRPAATPQSFWRLAQDFHR